MNSKDIELVRELLIRIDGTERDAAFAKTCIELLSYEEVEEKPKAERPKGKKAKPFDYGKLKALLDGGWSVAKIADEMRVSEQTIYNKIKKLEEQEHE